MNGRFNPRMNTRRLFFSKIRAVFLDFQKRVGDASNPLPPSCTPVCKFVVVMFTNTFGLSLLAKKDCNISVKRKTKHANLWLRCVAMIFFIVGHVPINISKVLVKLVLSNSFVTCQVTGKRVNRGAGYGLEIPVS